MNSYEMKTRREGPNSVKVVPVIEVKIMKGIGIEGDKMREVTEYWDLNGDFLAERDTDPTLLCDLTEWKSERLKKVIEDFVETQKLQDKSVRS